LVGKCKGKVETSDADKPFDKNQGAIKLIDDKGQKTALFETKYRSGTYPPVYTVVIENI